MSSGFRALSATLKASAEQAKETKKALDDVARSVENNPRLSALTDPNLGQIDVASIFSRVDQQGFAKAVEQGPFGQYLDEIARIMAYLSDQSKEQNAGEIAKRNRLLNSLTVYENIVRTYGGAEGRKISFDQLFAEVQKLVRSQERAGRDTRRTGTAGVSPSESCGGGGTKPAGSSLAVMRVAGGLP